MTTTSTATIAPIVAANLATATFLGEKLVADIPAEKFAHMPHPTMNHAAFCLGHLSIYPNKVLEWIGREGLVVEKDGFAALFEAGVECVEQDGRYPSKDEIVSYYLDRYRTVLEALDGVSDDILVGENPAEGRFKEMCPTIGSAVSFLLSGHHMMHLGQISAWRRAVGLGSIM